MTAAIDRGSANQAPGWGFEWASALTLGGYPFVHIAIGFDARGRPRVARGVIAIGQFAVGLISIGQFGLGILCGLGQFMIAPACLAQFGIGLIVCAQFALGWAVTGQFAIGYAGAALSWGYFHSPPGP